MLTIARSLSQRARKRGGRRFWFIVRTGRMGGGVSVCRILYFSRPIRLMPSGGGWCKCGRQPDFWTRARAKHMRPFTSILRSFMSFLRRIAKPSQKAQTMVARPTIPRRDREKPNPAWNENATAALAECERRIDAGEDFGGVGFEALAQIPRNFAKTTGKHFDFSCTSISDISALSQRPDIEGLALGKKISDISVLAKLSALQELVAYKATPTDISALRHCRSLSRLQLNVEFVQDLSPLAELHNLERVELWNYRGQALWPAAAVRFLSLVGCAGSAVDLTPVASWNEIRMLQLSQGQIKGRLPILPTVEFLGIAGCNDGHFSALSGYTALEQLFAYDSDVSDLAPLANCARLRTVSLSKTRISDFDPLLDKPLLSDVDVSETKVTHISKLSWLPDLRALRADKTAVADLSGWNPHSAITSLSLANTQVTDLSPLGGTQLRWLNVSDTPISDLAPIDRLPALTGLLFSRTLVSDLKPVLRHPQLLHDSHADYREHMAWRLAFEDTPAARSSETLLKISQMKDQDFNNKQKALRELYGIPY
jgi:Leucine-rich repeat (LRR) protein